jgi:hypothetical protein
MTYCCINVEILCYAVHNAGMGCPHGFTLVGRGCYKLTDNLMSRNEADAKCAEQGAAIASFRSEQDMRWVTASFLRVEHLDNPVWINRLGSSSTPLGSHNCAIVKTDHTYLVEVPCAENWFYGLCAVDATPVDGASAYQGSNTVVTITVNERTGHIVRTTKYAVDAASVHSQGAIATAVHRSLVMRLPVFVEDEQVSHDGKNSQERAVATRDSEVQRLQRVVTEHKAQIAARDSDVHELNVAMQQVLTFRTYVVAAALLVGAVVGAASTALWGSNSGGVSIRDQQLIAVAVAPVLPAPVDGTVYLYS